MIKHLVPKDYRGLLEYISPAAFKVIDWKKASTQFYEMSKKAFDQDFVSKIADHNIDLFSDNTILAEGDHDARAPQTSEQEMLAKAVLDCYFSQFFSEQGVFLDLRLKHFSVSKQKVNFHPGSLLHAFSDTFRAGMLMIYEGYYLGRPEQIEEGMLQVGLINSRDPQETQETLDLLFAHFGEADQGPIYFELEAFKESFHSLFLHLKQKKMRISSDFLFLGIYLVTLYIALAKLGIPIDVKKHFIASWERNNASEC